MYIQNIAFEYTASSSALSSRMVATSLAKSPPSLMKFLRSSKPVFPFFEVVLWSKSPLERLLGIIELILDITSLAPSHHFSLGLIWIQAFRREQRKSYFRHYGNPDLEREEILFRCLYQIWSAVLLTNLLRGQLELRWETAVALMWERDLQIGRFKIAWSNNEEEEEEDISRKSSRNGKW